MGLRKLVVALSAVAVAVAIAGCKHKVGDKCQDGQAFCTPEGMLFCESGKLALSPCRGPKGCTGTGINVACDTSLSNVGEGCETADDVSCALDKKAVHTCKNHKWELEATCKGPKNCEIKGDELFCDHKIADKDDACHRDGQYACSADKQFILRCKDNKMSPINSCRGPNGCSSQEIPEEDKVEFSCDDWLAQEGDPCEHEDEHSCSTDKKAVFVCKGGKFVAHKQCTGANGCSFDSKAEKILCDMGKEIYSGTGGVAKASSTSDKATTASKGAKTATSATAKASVSAKPAGSASAASSSKPAGSASASGTASAAASASGKPVASASAKAATSASAKTAKKK
jgi:hypothetical protein